jgi:hypothetical protein
VEDCLHCAPASLGKQVEFVLHLVSRCPIYISSHIYYSPGHSALLVYLHTGCGAACFTAGQEPDGYCGGEVQSWLPAYLVASLIALQYKNFKQEF